MDSGGNPQSKSKPAMSPLALVFSVVSVALVGAASFGYEEHGQELEEYGHHDFEEQEKKNDYNFKYSVHDPHTNGYHGQQELRKDGVVSGYYALTEADGALREVHYTADKEHGFRAVVTRNGQLLEEHQKEQQEQQQKEAEQQHEAQKHELQQHEVHEDYFHQQHDFHDLSHHHHHESTEPESEHVFQHY